jgi:hypothetical protein
MIRGESFPLSGKQKQFKKRIEIATQFGENTPSQRIIKARTTS